MKAVVSASSSGFCVRVFHFLLISAAMLSAWCAPALAQESSQATASALATQPLITQPIDESQLTTLKGNTHPLAKPIYDVGIAPATLPMERMLLVLKRSPLQEAALRKLLDDQQDKDSPNYHKWLTPEQFGKQFGPTDADMQTITAWLQSHGFQVGTTKGRTVLEFSGSASQVQEAFHTTIHKYVVNGEQHWANASDPQIPTALTPAIAGIMTLHNFLKKPHYILSKEKGKIIPGKHPQVTLEDGSHALAPGDYAVIYNISPVYSTLNINGSGITIGVVARSDIELSDFAAFQSLLGFSSNTPVVIVNGSDPGDVPGDDLEGTLDATWSQSIAPGATVNFVISASTDTTDGVDLSSFYIVENNLSNIMTESFGSCEEFNEDAQIAGTAALAEQAAAQGITYMASTGDAGAEGCDDPNTETVATGPISVNLPASTPFTVAVGGTEFNDTADPSKYWSSTNNTGPEGQYSALSYIPEDVWNDSCPASSCGASDANIAAGGGGESLGNLEEGGTTPGFAKPSWQSGVTGIPTTNARYVPDVALTASGNDGYLLCFQGSCASDEVYVVGGTSASTPSFAAIMALVDQRMGQVLGASATRQGLADYILYPLAASESFASCNGSSTSTPPANTCTFNDVTVGNNQVPGEPGYPSAPYNSNVGYDPASGLGSVNVDNLVKNWASATFRPTTTTLGLSPTTSIVHGTAVNVTISVAPTSGTGTPEGDVSLIASVGGASGGSSSVGGFTLSSGSFSGTTSQLPGGTSYQVTAHYAGNNATTGGFFAPSNSSPVTVTVTAENSTTALTAETFALSGSTLNVVSLSSGTTGYGNLVYFHADVQGNSGNGFPTGTVSFNDASGDPAIPGNPYPLNGGTNQNPGVSTAVTAQGLYTLSPGSYSVTANYVGDKSFNASASAAIPFTITQAATSVAVTPSATSITSGGSITLTANVSTGTATVPSFGAAPTGTVKFFENGTLIGTAQPVSGTAGTGSFTGGTFNSSSATAALTTTSLPNGSLSITASYSGDTNYATSTSSGEVVNVGNIPDFKLPTGGLGTVTVSAPGGNGTVNLSITPQNGFTGAVTFTCLSTTLPAESQCSTGTIAAGQTTGTMTVTTTGPHQVSQLQKRHEQYVAWWTIGSGLSLGGVFLFGSSRRRRWSALMSLIVLALLAALPSCGGGGSGSQTDPGTPVGTSTVTVTATSGTLSHTTNFTLTVQ